MLKENTGKKEEQHLLEINQSGKFWKQFGKVGINSMKSPMIPWEIVADNQIITDTNNNILYSHLSE